MAMLLKFIDGDCWVQQLIKSSTVRDAYDQWMVIDKHQELLETMKDQTW